MMRMRNGLAALVLATGAAQVQQPVAATAAAPALLAPPANGEMGFVVHQFHTAVHNGDEKTDCPDGLLGVFRDSYLRTLTAAEQARLNRPENENEREAAWKVYGRNAQNGNICANVYEFMDRPPTPLMKGRVARGFNLDNDETGGGTDSYTCKHENFTSPTGERGIDHQLWRVQGCSAQYRGMDSIDGSTSEHRRGYDDLVMTGQWTQVIILRGVNSLANDPDVKVVYANTDDRPVTDSSGRPVHHASFTVASEGRKLMYRNVLQGRIVNGVLTTEPRDILLTQRGGGSATDFDLARGRLQLEFRPDGTVKGMAGGYQPLLNLLDAPRRGGAGSVNIAGIDCAGQYSALRLMADGDKDPKTGKCRKISYAYELYAVPAFVNDVEPARRISAR